MNKNRLFYCMITCLCSAALMTSCAPKATDNTAAPTEANTTAAVEGNTALVTPAMIYEARTPYLGDAVAAGRLTGLLKRYYGIEESHTTELQTKYQPYGLTLHFEEEADNAAMQKMAAALISLIDNCSSVSWDYPTDAEGNHARFYLSYEALPQTLDEVAGHIKEYADSEAGFQTLLDQLETVREHLPAVKREKTVERAAAGWRRLAAFYS